MFSGENAKESESVFEPADDVSDIEMPGNEKDENKENSNSKRSKKKNHSRIEIFHFNKI